MARYFHSLGLYFPGKIGNARVLLFKSGLAKWLAAGQATPSEIGERLVGTVKPKVFITTGTGQRESAQDVARAMSSWRHAVH